MTKHFMKTAWHAGAPLAAWALHFGFCYVLVAVQCTRSAVQSSTPLWLATFAALAWCGWMLWKAWPALRGEAPLAAQARAVTALLAIAAISWTALPMLLLGGCE